MSLNNLRNAATKMNPEDISLKSEQYLGPDNLSTTDCTFVFNGEEIRAHRLVLSCCSPVFEKMFYGRMASNRINITDIDLEDFRLMLKYIYTNTLRIKSVLHAWSLFYVAHKYLLDNLAEICISYIQQNLNISNLVLNYEYAEMYGIEHLQNLCMSDIADYIRGIFIKKCDYHMKSTSLLRILEQSTLNISNIELLIGVLNWAVIECDIKNMNLSPENIINFLKSAKILQHLVDLDFPVNPNSDSLILKCCQSIKSFKNPTVPYKHYFKKHWCIFCKCRQTYKIAGRLEMRESDVLISNISTNRNCLLYGLVVVTENEKVGNQKTEYNGVIRIQISEIDNPETIVNTIFSKVLFYESSVYVPLSDVIYLETGKIYKIKIGYQNLDNFTDLRNGKSSILCNYMSNKLVDARRNIVFSFDELDGSVIRGISYYPA